MLALGVACAAPADAQPAASGEAEPAAATSTPFITQEQHQAALQVVRSKPELLSADDSRATLREILARPEFASGSAVPRTSLIEQSFDWLSRALSRVGMKTPSWTGVVAIALVCLGLIYLITRVIWEWQARRSRRIAPEIEAGDIALGADALLKALAEAVARGDYRAAVRLRFRWLLSALELGESALLTNRQLQLRLGREHPAVREPLQRLVTCFEDAWYGGLPVSQAEVQLAASLAENVRDSVRREQP